MKQTQLLVVPEQAAWFAICQWGSYHDELSLKYVLWLHYLDLHVKLVSWQLTPQVAPSQEKPTR